MIIGVITVVIMMSTIASAIFVSIMIARWKTLTSLV